MSDTVYLVRLHRPFYSLYDTEIGESRDVGAANGRAFRTLADAGRFAQTVAPKHSPFAVDAVEWNPDDSEFDVSFSTDETDWEHYVLSDGTYRGKEEGGEIEFESVDERCVPESDLIAAIRNAGLSVPTNADRDLDTWNGWWDANAPTMTDAQRAAVWFALTGNPYLIVALEAEL